MPVFSFYQQNARWLLAGLLITGSSSFGQTYFISLFGAELRAAFGLSDGLFGWLYSVATISSAATLIGLGSLADRWTVPRLVLFSAAGLTCACLSMAVLSLNSSSVGTMSALIWLGATLFGLRLFGQGMMSHIGFTAMGRWFNLQRGKAVAIATLGFPLGEGLLPALTVMLMGLIGWGETWIAVACFLSLVLVPSILYLIRRSRTPQTTDESLLESAQARQREWTRAEVLRDPLFWALMPGVLAPSFIQTGVLFHQTRLVDAKGWTLESFSLTYLFYGASSVVAMIIAGWAIDRFSAVKTLPVSLVPLFIGLFVLSQSDASWVGFVFMMASGMSAGLVATLLGALWPELYGTRHLGAIRTPVIAAMVFSTALAPGVMGSLLDHRVALDVQFFALGIYALLASAVFLALVPRMKAHTAQF
ncbi:MAG: MFS transporter [Pseudomonadota bacterium]